MQPHRLGVTRLLAPHWKLLTIALAAMIVESSGALREPRPLKLVFDHVIGAKPPPQWLSGWARREASPDLLSVAAVAVVVIALLRAASSYVQKSLSTTVGTRVGCDLRRLL